MPLVRRSSVTGVYDANGGEMARPTNLLEGRSTDASLRITTRKKLAMIMMT